MPKLQLNSGLTGLQGTMDGWVYKHYKGDKRGVVLSRKPDMSKVTPSPAQLAQRAAMRKAGAFHRQVLADPGLLAKYRKLAKRDGITLSAATMREVLRAK